MWIKKIILFSSCYRRKSKVLLQFTVQNMPECQFSLTGSCPYMDRIHNSVFEREYGSEKTRTLTYFKQRLQALS